jgi:hypothetical protein
MIELLVPAVGAIIGYLLTAWSESSKQKHEQMIALIGKTDDSMDKASKRGSSLLRRFLVISMVLLFVGVSVGGAFTTVAYVSHEPVTSILFGLIEWGGQEVVLPVEGLLYTSELKEAVMSIIGFLLGTHAAK